jgi:predicted dehydrogenase
VSNHANEYPIIYRKLEEAIDNERPDYIIVANSTSDHKETLESLIELGFSGLVLVEKPLFESQYDLSGNRFKQLFVGYNLRFHPMITRLNDFVVNNNILSVQAYAGQYLPQWRPDRDYSICYSSSKKAGGGVIRDLSHELDYLNWLFGGWKRIVAQVGRFSQLKIDSDDLACLVLEMGKCSIVNVQLNYLDRICQREIIINSDQHTVRADLVQGLLNMDGLIEEYKVDRDFTYRAMHLAIMTGDYKNLCTYEQGIEVLKMITASESSTAGERWIYNE